MSYNRRMRRIKRKQEQQHMKTLAILLSDFYEFLSKSPQPTEDEVRNTFIDSNKKWKQYCANHKLMNVSHLFVLNVKESWERHIAEHPQSTKQ